MSECNHKECFGTLFPDVLHLLEDKPTSGKVFTVLMQKAGGMFRCNRTVTADLEQWQDCQQCPDFESCYKFSIAKLALEGAIHDQ